MDRVAAKTLEHSNAKEQSEISEKPTQGLFKLNGGLSLSGGVKPLPS